MNHFPTPNPQKPQPQTIFKLDRCKRCKRYHQKCLILIMYHLSKLLEFLYRAQQSFAEIPSWMYFPIIISKKENIPIRLVKVKVGRFEPRISLTDIYWLMCTNNWTALWQTMGFYLGETTGIRITSCSRTRWRSEWLQRKLILKHSYMYNYLMS